MRGNRILGALVLALAVVIPGCTTNKDVTREMHAVELRSDYLTGRIAARWSATEEGARRIQRWFFHRTVGNELEGCINDEIYIDSSKGDHQIRVRIFKPLNVAGKLPAMLYLHGGGYMMGAPEHALPFYAELLQRRDLAIIAPAYRLSLDHPYPAGFDDAYDTLDWMRENADALGIFPDGFIIAGHSAGGGMCAGVTLKVRDMQNLQISFQMPLYPMLDYRQQIASAANMKGALFWDTKSNAFGWERYLRGIGNNAVPAYASPAINDDYRGLPPAISFVGTLDPLVDETEAYMKALGAAAIPIRFQVFEGAYHGFDGNAPDTEIGTAAREFLFNAFEDYYDRYAARQKRRPTE